MKSKILLILFILILIACGAGGTYYYYSKYQEVNTKLNNPEKTAQDEVAKLVGEIGTIMELPGDEQPTVATVLDKDKLKDQGFFAHAENGDKVVIYSKARKAILYRESAKKIIEVAPIDLSQPEASAQPSPKATKTPAPTPEETVAPSPTN